MSQHCLAHNSHRLLSRPHRLTCRQHRAVAQHGQHSSITTRIAIASSAPVHICRTSPITDRSPRLARATLGTSSLQHERCSACQHGCDIVANPRPPPRDGSTLIARTRCCRKNRWAQRRPRRRSPSHTSRAIMRHPHRPLLFSRLRRHTTMLCGYQTPLTWARPPRAS